MQTICEYQTPINLGSEAKPDFEYSEITCDYSQLYEYVSNETTTASFYLEKSFTYGDFFIMFFLTIFGLVKIVEIIWNKYFEK